VVWEVVALATIHTCARNSDPYYSVEEAMSRRADLVTALGARLSDDGEVAVVAPGGLADLFELRVRPNIATPTSAAIYQDHLVSMGWLVGGRATEVGMRFLINRYEQI